MNRLTLLAVTLLIGTVSAVPASAACAGAPLSSLLGTWAFQTSGSQYYGGVLTGVFTATIGGGRGGGALDLLVTSNSNSTGVYSASVYQGVYEVDGNCTRGSLQFFNGRPNLYDFYFTNVAKTELFLIGMEWHNPFSGIAKKIQ